MFKKFVLLILAFYSGQLSAQTAISGYVHHEDPDEASTEIHLSQINLKDIPSYDKARKIATSTIAENGFFQFERELIEDEDAIYQLSYDPNGDKAEDSLKFNQLFILSNRDSIRFKKSIIPFSIYTNSNFADKEWQRLRKFEQLLRPVAFKKEDSLSVAYIGGLKTYAKDSLETLMVKLIGIKQLDNKLLLEKDITKNPAYYVALLTELKESDIDRSDYLFLENKLAFLTTEVVENKYATSKIINILLGLAVVGLMLLLFRLKSKKNQLVISDLSNQERNIQGLILQGKSNKEIASELFISLSTVKTHITNIYGKLQVSSRKELLQKAQNS